MIEEKQKKLIDKLIEKTSSKKAFWSKTSRDDEYKLSLENGSITTDQWEDMGGDYVDFTIRNKRGDIISQMTFGQNEESFKLLSKLHNVAKENYHKVDETIDDIFKELDTKEEIGNGEDDDDEFVDLTF